MSKLGLHVALLFTNACVLRADLGYWSEQDAQLPPERDAAISDVTDGELPPSAAVPSSFCARPRLQSERCAFGDVRLPEELSGDPYGAARAFAGGASLPAGRYRIEYLDGCIRYMNNIIPIPTAEVGFTVHATALDPLTGAGAFWFVV